MATPITFSTGDIVEFPEHMPAWQVERRRQMISDHIAATGRMPRRVQDSYAASVTLDTDEAKDRSPRAAEAAARPQRRSLLASLWSRVLHWRHVPSFRPTGFEILKQYRSKREARDENPDHA
jgi:muconolactone delta-isomerase